MIIVFSLSEHTDLKEWLINKAKNQNVHMNTVIREILEKQMKNDRQTN